MLRALPALLLLLVEASREASPFDVEAAVGAEAAGAWRSARNREQQWQQVTSRRSLPWFDLHQGAPGKVTSSLLAAAHSRHEVRSHSGSERRHSEAHHTEVRREARHSREEPIPSVVTPAQAGTATQEQAVSADPAVHPPAEDPLHPEDGSFVGVTVKRLKSGKQLLVEKLAATNEKLQNLTLARDELQRHLSEADSEISELQKESHRQQLQIHGARAVLQDLQAFVSKASAQLQAAMASLDEEMEPPVIRQAYLSSEDQQAQSDDTPGTIQKWEQLNEDSVNPFQHADPKSLAEASLLKQYQKNEADRATTPETKVEAEKAFKAMDQALKSGDLQAMDKAQQEAAAVIAQYMKEQKAAESSDEGDR